MLENFMKYKGLRSIACWSNTGTLSVLTCRLNWLFNTKFYLFVIFLLFKRENPLNTITCKCHLLIKVTSSVYDQSTERINTLRKPPLKS